MQYRSVYLIRPLYLLSMHLPFLHTHFQVSISTHSSCHVSLLSPPRSRKSPSRLGILTPDNLELTKSHSAVNNTSNNAQTAATMARRRAQHHPSTAVGFGILIFLLVVFCPLALLPVAGASASPDYSTTVQPHEPIIGVDLGTTYSCVGVMKDGKVEILVNDQGEAVPFLVFLVVLLGCGTGWVAKIASGNRITPSYVAFAGGERLIGASLHPSTETQGGLPDSVTIGDAAKNQFTSNPRNTVFDIKFVLSDIQPSYFRRQLTCRCPRRLIGRSFSDKEVKADIKHMPFKVKAGPADKPVVEIDVGDQIKTFAPEEISAMVLGKMKEVAENYLGQK